VGKQIELFRSEEKKQAYFKIYDMALEQMPVAFETKYVDTSFGNTHLIHCGKVDSPKLILLHCMGFASTCWYKNLETLSKNFDVYCIDSIGEPGKTETYKTKIRKENYFKWLIEILDNLKLDKVNIAGWSFGGFLATGFAMNHPERVERIVAMSPAGTISPITITFYLKLLPALFGGKDKKINQFLKWISGNDNSDYPNPAFSVFTAGMKSFKGWATGTKIVVYSDNDFKKLKVPYLILIGNKDPIYKSGIHNQLVGKYKKINHNVEVEMVNGTHGFPIQQSEKTNERIVSFFLNT